VLLLPAGATAGGPPTRTFAAGGDDAELFPRIENSTFPLPPRAHGEERVDPALASNQGRGR
jgi:hypothetical protein